MVKFFKFRSAKPGTTSAPRVLQAGGIGPAVFGIGVPSALLHDVLGKDGALNSPHPKTPKPTAQPLSQRLNVGARLGDAKRLTIEAATRLAALVDDETAEMLGSVVAELESRVCRIAVIGQMNAGKSSLINVLVEQTELLPADINPWTSVVTRLHFGVAGKPPSGASFSFFTLDEWRRLSTGGRTRELTERLFPDFDWEALREQVETMQKRAGQKLGPRFETLLGTEHSYDAITPGLLSRYVGAGHPDAAGGTSSSDGEFSDITKIADVFFDLGAFNFPTILIDTPGVNDPFLVRDEITRQSLQAADICVIVVTARQPLSTADLSLLRLLRGLDKKRLIIFLNKIDEIDASEGVLHDVSQRVSAILSQEFPSANIPIVFGSAHWARKALTTDDAEANASVRSPEDILNSISGFYWPEQPETGGSMSADALLMKSGLSQLAVVISELMQSGPVADAIDTSRNLIEAVCRNCIACFETEIQVLSKASPDASLARDECAKLIAVRQALAERFDAFSQELAGIQSEKLTQLQGILDETVRVSFTEAFSDPQDGTPLTHVSQLDMRLRVDLENAFMKAFDDAAQAIAGAHNHFNAEVKTILQQHGLVEKLATVVNGGDALSRPPSLAALGEPAALGLGAAFGGLPQEQGDDLLQVIVRDFQPIVTKLSGEAAVCLFVMSAGLIQKMRTLTLRPLEAAIERISKALSEGEAGPEPDEARLAQELEDAREMIARLSHILAADIPAIQGSQSPM